MWLFNPGRQFDPAKLMDFLRMLFVKASHPEKFSVAERRQIGTFTADKSFLKSSLLSLLDKTYNRDDIAIVIWTLGMAKAEKAAARILSNLHEMGPHIDEGGSKVRMASIEALKRMKYFPAVETFLRFEGKSSQEIKAALDAALSILESSPDNDQFRLSEEDRLRLKSLSSHPDQSVRNSAGQLLVHTWSKDQPLGEVSFPAFWSPFSTRSAETAQA